MFPKPVRTALAVSLIVLSCGGCDRIEDDGRDRFTAAVQPFCALWGETQLSLQRLGSHCPWGGAGAPPAPCAIEHFLGDSDAPRTVRRIASDAQGRVLRMSDARGDRTGRALQFQYEQEGQAIVRHRYRVGCQDPAPVFLSSETFELDALGVAASWPRALGGAHAEHRIERGWLGDEAWLDADVAGERHSFRIDGSGNVVERSLRGKSLELAQTIQDGRVIDEVLPGLHPGRDVKVHYDYDAQGRLATLHLSGPKGQKQRYRFRYDCQQGPACGDGTSAGPGDPLAFDPELMAFAPDNCSEQAAYSPNLCDVVASQGRALSLSCCRSSPDRISAQLESPLARAAVAYMRIETASGTTLESLDCTRAREASDKAWRCEFGRAALAMLPTEPAALVLVSDNQQALLSMPIELGVWLEATR